MKHVTFKTYGEFSQSSYVFSVSFPDGSVASVPIDGVGGKRAFDGEFEEKDAKDAFKEIEQMTHGFKVNTMKWMTELMKRKGMSSVTSGPLVTDSITSHELKKGEDKWLYEFDHDDRISSLSSEERLEFKNWAELFIIKQCNWGRPYETQPTPSASMEITNLDAGSISIE